MLQEQQVVGQEQENAELQDEPNHRQQDPSILVYAQLPNDVSQEALTLNDNDNWMWTPILEFPIDKLNALRLSNKPYKWLRYATGVVLGVVGDLRQGEDMACELVAYEGDTLPAVTTKLYYHVLPRDRQSIFPVDLKFAEEGITSSAMSERRSGFREEVAQRDNDRCVVSGVLAPGCDAAHIVALAKGDLVSNFRL